MVERAYRELEIAGYSRTTLRTLHLVLAKAFEEQVDRTLNENALDPTAFERIIHRVRTAMPSLDIPTKSWLAQATKILNENPPKQGLARTDAKPCPPNEANTIARKVAGLPAAYPPAAGLPRISTVHQVKGDEAEAVLICLPRINKRKPILAKAKPRRSWRNGYKLTTWTAKQFAYYTSQPPAPADCSR